MPILQSNRLISVSTPLGDDVLLFRRMTGSEKISQLFEYELDLLSENNRIAPARILGQNICVRLTLKDGKHRYFNGFVSRFGAGGTDGEYNSYRAIVRPWLWFLTRRSNCRIFQNKSIPDIVKQVCHDDGFTDIEDQLSESYPELVYCVQYRETDFNFISRLLEKMGIAYYFKHEKNKHTLVLADSISAYTHVSAYETVPYFHSETNVQLREDDHIHEWEPWQQVTSGNYVLNDYDFEKPKANLIAKSTDLKDYAYAEFEQYDCPGEYLKNPDGDKLVSNRMQELHTDSVGVLGSGNVRGMTNGALFNLENYPVDDQNREYLVTSTGFFLQSNTYLASRSSEAVECRCNFLAMDSRQRFVPGRITPSPFVQGPQTAVVVGPSGEEIYTDEHGRVKVQFHWDREGKKDENSSCWIRVSQMHAGKGFGGIDIPRIGEEVIVDFLEGDPNKPIVTGRVYNGVNKPPNGLPAAAMVSGLKSNSTPGGGGDNTIMLDDTKGKEKITIHGQYDMDTTVEHDQTNTVNNKFTETIKSDATIKITEGNLNHNVVAGTATFHVQGAVQETYDNKQVTTVANEIVISSTGSKVHINAASEIQLQVGASTLLMKSDGTIKLDGVDIAINGASSVNIHGKSVTSEADADHNTKGAIVVSNGSATNTVKGGTVMLNP